MTVSPALRLPPEVALALGNAAAVFEDWLQATLRTGTVASELGPALSARFDLLDTGIARADADIVKVRSDVDALRLNFDALRLEFDALRLEFDALRTEVGDLRTEVAELRGQVTILNNSTVALGEDMRAMRTDMNQRFDAMGARFDDRIDRSTRWSVGLLALFGTMVTVLLGFETLMP